MMVELCCNCGALCCGSLRIEAFKNRYHFFCSNCFYLFDCINIKDLRRILKHNDNFVTIN